MDSSSKKNVVISVPDDLITNILRRLPVKSLMRLKCVCKLWRSLISRRNKLIIVSSSRHPPVSMGHLSIKSVDFKASKIEAMQLDFPFPCSHPHGLHVICGCDGLLCIQIEKEAAILWNPSSGRYKRITIPINSDSTDHDQFGLGYDHSTHDYKIVRLRHGKSLMSYQTYSLNTDSWEQEVTLPWKMFPVNSLNNWGIQVNGVYYWKNCFGISVNGALYWNIILRERESLSFCILCFDLTDHKFRLIHLPMDHVGRVPKFQILGKVPKFEVLDFEGRLCSVHYAGRCKNIDIWTMKSYNYCEEEEKQKQNWIKLMSIPEIPEEILQIPAENKISREVVCFKNGQVLLLITAIPGSRDKTMNAVHELVLYNSEENTFKKFEIEGEPAVPLFYQLIAHTESLIYSPLQFLR